MLYLMPKAIGQFKLFKGGEIVNWFKRLFEKRETLEQALMSAGALPNDELVSKEQALNIPSLSACVELICNTIAGLPIYLYKENGIRTEIVNDYRVALLNDDTQDTLNGNQFKRAMVEDYLLKGAGYCFIKRNRNTIKSIHFVDNAHVGVNAITDPIFKSYNFQVNGLPYREWEFIKFTRKSKDGVTGKGIIAENNKILSVVYNSLVYEEVMVKSGGNKKGFIKAQSRLSADAITELKNAWNRLYKNNTENVVILNNGLEFVDASNTSVEMQLSENKQNNSDEISKLFLVPSQILTGKANDEEYNNWIKVCIIPILNAFECALNKDLLLPSEKESFYFAFDYSELIKGSILERYQAYEIGTKNGILQIDEVRYKENLAPLGLEFVKLGLQDVLYNPKTKEIYTPNTNQTNNIEQAKASDPEEVNNNESNRKNDEANTIQS